MPDIDVGRLMRLIPHRYPMLLIDRLTAIEPPDRATGVKCVTVNERLSFRATSRTTPSCRACSSSRPWRRPRRHWSSPGRAGKARAISSTSWASTRAGSAARCARATGSTSEVERQKTRLGIHWFKGRALVEGKLCADAIVNAKLLTREEAGIA
jgi:hypothetical protein